MSTSTVTDVAVHPLRFIAAIKPNFEMALRLHTLETYDMSVVVNRMKRKQLLPDALIDDALLEFKRLMALCVLGHRGIVVPCEEVDEVWHTFMLFTREYAAFCHTIAGGFIHHAPPESTWPSASGSEDFWSLYARYFGTTLENDIQKKYVIATPSICQSSVACGVE